MFQLLQLMFVYCLKKLFLFDQHNRASFTCSDVYILKRTDINNLWPTYFLHVEILPVDILLKKTVGLEREHHDDLMFRMSPFGVRLTVGVLFANVVVLMLVFYHEAYNSQVKLAILSLTEHTFGTAKPSDKIIIFPANIPMQESKLEPYYKHLFGVPPQDHAAIVKGYSGAMGYFFSQYRYSKDTFLVFHTQTDLGKDKQCPKLAQDITVEVSPSQFIDADLYEIVDTFRKENSGYYQDIKPFFDDYPLEKMFEEKTLETFCYRLAGSLVWLEQYRVHYMISRIVFSPWNRRDKPNLSLTYAQIFDENWEELKNVELIFPTNNPDMGVTSNIHPEDLFMTQQFPSIVPIPFYHNTRFQKEGYNGPEDPRIILVKNPRGYEEPLIMFNAMHRKVKEQVLDLDQETKVNYHLFRSMFMCWPWQTQRGKYNVDDLRSPNDDKLYTRITEIRKYNSPRSQQKNWTPLTSFHEREHNGYDKFLYLVYQWKNLEIMKCPLVDNVDSVIFCTMEYRLPGLNNVGPLRGGTELVNVNQFLDQYKNVPDVVKVTSGIPPGREIWFGFARAHFKECGCGKHFYRPNLVVVTRDLGRKYKVSHISLFLSLGVRVQGWDMSSVNEVCFPDNPNAMIPNGISKWTLNSEFQDVLTLSYSISDATVELIHIRGLLLQLLANDFDPETKRHRLFGPTSAFEVGFNDDNVDCAMDKSEKYCKAYGEMHKLEENLQT